STGRKWFPANAGSQPLFSAASSYGHIEIVKLLLDHSADVNAKATVNWTALMAASRGDHAEIVRLLLGHGADVNVKGSRGTALKTASIRLKLAMDPRLKPAGMTVL
ncbi:MAG: ankyrin repeat domain-containing protein, partial [Gemmatimonadota bacterium]|nr:ankyrin repeat domain-containing protein [Gemmatimonadota bacterium]